MTLFGTFGIRGIVNKDLTPELALKMGMSFATLVKDGTLVVGCDGRSSSEMIKNSFISGVISCGVNVIDIGMVPTPVVMFATKTLKTKGGIMITASHNPPEYNGIKFLEPNGMGLKKEKESIIEEIIKKEDFNLRNWKEIGEIEKKNILSDYFKEILSFINKEKIENLKIVIDCGNGVGSLTLPYLLEKVGCRVITLNSHIDGAFPGRGSEPTPENLKSLGEIVKRTNSDFGVALDGDADRAIFVDEKGNFIQGDRSLALIIKNFIKNREENVVTTVSTSHVIDDVVGERIIKTKIGDLIVARKLLECGGIIGGEESGGVIFPEFVPGKNGDLATLKMAEIISENKKPLSKLIDELPKYYQYKEKIPCENKYKEKVINKIDKKLTEYKKDTTDGVKVFTENGWFIVRASGTEPIIRCYSESKDKKEAKRLVEFGLECVKETMDKML